MTTTVLGIYNAAISAVRGKGRLAALTDVSREKSECDIWYDQIRTQVFEAAYWPATRATARLALLNTRDQTADWALGDPETEYLYSYVLPSNCLRPWHLVNYEQFTVSFNEVDNKLVLNTNVADAVLIYARDNTNPAFWSPGLRLAVVYGLAAAVSGGIKGDSSLTELNFQLANRSILEARANVTTQLNNQQEVLPPALAARGASIVEETRFFYPYGDLFAGAMPNA